MKKSLILALMCLNSLVVNAATLQLSVSGQIAPVGGVSSNFTANITFDSSVVDNQQLDIDFGAYNSSLGNGVLIYNDVTYHEVGTENPVLVYNNSPDILDNDSFTFIAFFQSDDGVFLELGFQFVDASNIVFGDDSHPNSFSLDQFDPFDEFDPFGSTVASLFFLDSAVNVFGPIETAELRIVPLPAGIWLLLSTVAVFLGAARGRTH